MSKDFCGAERLPWILWQQSYCVVMNLKASVTCLTHTFEKSHLKFIVWYTPWSKKQYIGIWLSALAHYWFNVVIFLLENTSNLKQKVTVCAQNVHPWLWHEHMTVELQYQWITRVTRWNRHVWFLFTVRQALENSLVLVPELAHLRIFILRYTNVLIIIIIIIIINQYFFKYFTKS